MSKQSWYLNNFLTRFEENKDHLIDRLNIEEEQKEILKAFFKRYPNYESKIDWNRKDLIFKDFEELLANEGRSKSRAKKYGLEGLKLDEDYKIVFKREDLVIYYPLTFLASKTLANPKVAPLGVTGKWCISGGNYSPGNDSKYWDQYRKQGVDFFFIFTPTEKFAIARSSQNFLEVYDSEDDRCALEDAVDSNSLDSVENLIRTYPRYLKDVGKIKTPEGCLLEDKYGYIHLISYVGTQPTLRIPSNVNVIEAAVFDEDKSIERVLLPKSISLMEDGAFNECTNLKEVIFEKESEIRVLPVYCFGSCFNLKRITLSDKIFHIDSYAFYACSRLEDITLPDSLKVVGSLAFAYCTSLKKIVLPSQLTKIGQAAFENCSSLQSVEIRGCDSIQRGAFYSCSSLEEVILPKNIMNISEDAFENTPSLKIFRYPDTKENLIKSGMLETLEHGLALRTLKHPTSVKVVCTNTTISL